MASRREVEAAAGGGAGAASARARIEPIVTVRRRAITGLEKALDRIVGPPLPAHKDSESTEEEEAAGAAPHSGKRRRLNSGNAEEGKCGGKESSSIASWKQGFREAILGAVRKYSDVLELDAEESAKNVLAEIGEVYNKLEECRERVEVLRQTVPQQASQAFHGDLLALRPPTTEGAAAVGGGGAGAAPAGEGAAAAGGRGAADMLRKLQDLSGDLSTLKEPLQSTEQALPKVEEELRASVDAVTGALASNGSGPEALLHTRVAPLPGTAQAVSAEASEKEDQRTAARSKRAEEARQAAALKGDGVLHSVVSLLSKG